MKRTAPRTTVMYEGEALELYSLGWLAYVCHRTSRSLYLWEKAGVLPKPIFDIKDGRRWYCATELVGYNVIVERLTPERSKDSKNADLGKLKEAFHAFNHQLRRELSKTSSKEALARKLPMADEIASKLSEKVLASIKERTRARTVRILTSIGVLAEETKPGIRLRKKLAK